MGLPVLTETSSASDKASVTNNATEAAAVLKTLGHGGRLMILCHLVAGEKSVGALEDLMEMRQAAVSQQLARLRQDGLVIARRDGKTVYYALADDRPKQIIELVYDLFCSPRPD